MADQPPVIGAILAATKDSNVRLAMLLGSHLESSWSDTAVGDQGTSFGPFQIHLPAHPGVTQAEAENATDAVRLMLPAYQSAVSKVPASMWKSSPEQAAEQAAYLAERPAQTYYASRGESTVHTAYEDAVAALGGKYVPSPGGSSGSSGSSTSGGGSGSMLDAISGIGSSISGMTQAAETFVQDLAWITNPTNWVRIFAGVFGFLFVCGGLAFVAKGA